MQWSIPTSVGRQSPGPARQTDTFSRAQRTTITLMARLRNIRPHQSHLNWRLSTQQRNALIRDIVSVVLCHVHFYLHRCFGCSASASSSFQPLDLLISKELSKQTLQDQCLEAFARCRKTVPRQPPSAHMKPNGSQRDLTARAHIVHGCDVMSNPKTICEYATVRVWSIQS